MAEFSIKRTVPQDLSPAEREIVRASRQIMEERRGLSIGTGKPRNPSAAGGGAKVVKAPAPKRSSITRVLESGLSKREREKRAKAKVRMLAEIAPRSRSTQGMEKRPPVMLKEAAGRAKRNIQGRLDRQRLRRRGTTATGAKGL